jgi:hypothetical protein
VLHDCSFCSDRLFRSVGTARPERRSACRPCRSAGRRCECQRANTRCPVWNGGCWKGCRRRRCGGCFRSLVGDLNVASFSLANLAEMSVKAEDFERAVDFARESIELSWTHRNLINLGAGFGWLARAVSGLGDVRGAAIFWGAGERLDTELGHTMWRLHKTEVEAELAPAVLADKEGLAAGRALTTAEAVKLALRVPAA